MDDYKILVYMPNYHAKSGDSDVNRMKVLAPLVETAFEFAKNKEYFKALNLNSELFMQGLNDLTQDHSSSKDVMNLMLLAYDYNLINDEQVAISITINVSISFGISFSEVVTRVAMNSGKNPYSSYSYFIFDFSSICSCLERLASNGKNLSSCFVSEVCTYSNLLKSFSV